MNSKREVGRSVDREEVHGWLLRLGETRWSRLVKAISVWVSYFFFSSRRPHTRYIGDWSSDVCLPISADCAVDAPLRILQRRGVHQHRHLRTVRPLDQELHAAHRNAAAQRHRYRGRSEWQPHALDRKSTRLNSSHRCISYAVFCLKKKK